MISSGIVAYLVVYGIYSGDVKMHYAPMESNQKCRVMSIDINNKHNEFVIKNGRMPRNVSDYGSICLESKEQIQLFYERYSLYNRARNLSD